MSICRWASQYRITELFLHICSVPVADAHTNLAGGLCTESIMGTAAGAITRLMGALRL